MAPSKKRRNKAKAEIVVRPLGRQAEIKRLQDVLAKLTKKLSSPPLSPSIPLLDIDTQPPDEIVFDDFRADDTEPEPLFDTMPITLFDTPEVQAPRRTIPNQTANDLYARWSNALTGLVAPLLYYTSKTIGKILERAVRLQGRCQGCLTRKSNQVLCLFQDYFEKLTVDWCDCEDLLQVLVFNGLFPTAPQYPRMAISIHLLDFYRALFERSCDAVNAMAGALNTFYTRGPPFKMHSAED
ncbi:hypothetical protein DXG01_001098 [Tephrocybe rancida]|nr:hypothetical protein DXG01_001098 [Tephrocybe rancida]